MALADFEPTNYRAIFEGASADRVTGLPAPRLDHLDNDSLCALIDAAHTASDTFTQIGDQPRARADSGPGSVFDLFADFMSQIAEAAFAALSKRTPTEGEAGPVAEALVGHMFAIGVEPAEVAVFLTRFALGERAPERRH